MDKVRLGRAFGYGARHAAKTFLKAASAVAAPSPTPSRIDSAATPQNVRETVTRTGRATATAGKAVLAPVTKFTSVLWLEVTGTFFALIALVMAEGVWKLRSSFHLPLVSRDALWLDFHIAVFLAFAYFAISNFVRASRRQRR